VRASCSSLCTHDSHPDSMATTPRDATRHTQPHALGGIGNSRVIWVPGPKVAQAPVYSFCTGLVSVASTLLCARQIHNAARPNPLRRQRRRRRHHPLPLHTRRPLASLSIDTLRRLQAGRRIIHNNNNLAPPSSPPRRGPARSCRFLVPRARGHRRPSFSDASASIPLSVWQHCFVSR
jgi:hypothetical protein